MLTSIGRYQLRQVLGYGGMGTVYLAYDPVMQRDVALKLLTADFGADPTLRARFEREARFIAGLEHPGIVPVHDYGEAGGHPFMVMRYMQGGSLADRLARSPLPLDEATRIVQHVASALDAAHARGIVHRDIKPGNVLFDDYNFPYVADFGIAKRSNATATLTGSAVIGTPAYMSPEQALEHSVLDGRSDVYALGVTLYQMVTGTLPFDAPTPVALLLKHLQEPVPRPSAIVPGLPHEVDAVIQKAMAKDREQRFRTAGEMAASLAWAAAATRGMPAAPTAGAARTSRPGSSRAPVRLFAALGLGSVALVALIIGGLLRLDIFTPASTRTATATRTEAPIRRSSGAAESGAGAAVARVTATPTPAPEATDTATHTPAPSVTPTRAPTLTLTPEPPTPTATATPPPTATSRPRPTATPTRTPLPPLRSQSISIQPWANASLGDGYVSPPAGAVRLGDVEFNIPGGQNTITTQAKPLPNNPTGLELPVDIFSPQSVHLLITGGDAYSNFAGKQIGLVRLGFRSGQPVIVPLIAGVNVREWKILDQNTVAGTSSPAVREVWRTESRHGGGAGIIDMLTIDLGEAYANDRLVSIGIVDTSAETAGDLDPALNILGVTVIGR